MPIYEIEPDWPELHDSILPWLMMEEENRNHFNVWFANAEFIAPLTSSLLLTHGSGVPTYTRATLKTVVDVESKLCVLVSGEAAFTGARRVRNLVANSESAAVGVRGTVGATATAEAADFPAGVVGSIRLTITNAATLSYQKTTVNAAAGEIRRQRLWVKGEGASVGRTIKLFYLDNGGFASSTSADIALTAGWQIVTMPVSPAHTVGTDTAIGILAGTAGGIQTGDTMLCAGFQCENVTGQTNQNPSEYVSVGVLAAPFPSNVDGIKCFDFQNGNTVVGNVVTAAVGAPIALATIKGYHSDVVSTNLVLQSENFGATWVAAGTPTRVAAALRCGALVLDLLGDDDAAAIEGYVQAFAYTGDGVKGVSLHVAQGTSISTVVQVLDNTAAASRLFGSITWPGGIPTATMLTGTFLGADGPYANGVYRLRFATTAVVAANANDLRIFPATDNAATVANVGTVYVGGVQAENLTYCTSYIPTTAAAATRNGDTLTYVSAGNAQIVSGFLYAECFVVPVSGTLSVASISDGTLNNRVTIFSNGAGVSIGYRVISGGVSQLTNVGVNAPPVATVSKDALRWSAADAAAYLNGVLDRNTGAGITVPAAFTQINVGCGDAGTLSQPTGNIRNLRVGRLPPADSFMGRMTR